MNLYNCREEAGKRRVCEAETDWEERASAAANSSARLFQLLPSCLLHSTDTAGLRLPPHDTNAVPAAQLKWLPQNEVNSVHVLNWMWVAETTPDKAATTSLTVSPEVEEGPHHLAWFPPAGFARPGPEQTGRAQPDGWPNWDTMANVTSCQLLDRRAVAVDSLERSSLPLRLKSDGSPENRLPLIIWRRRASEKSEACQHRTSSSRTSNTALHSCTRLSSWL